MTNLHSSSNENMSDSVSSISSWEPETPTSGPTGPQRYQAISPLSSTRTRRSIDGNTLSMFRSNMPWEDHSEDENLWSDAATAGTVLSLLHREPLSPQRNNHRPLFDSTASERQRSRCVICFQIMDRLSYPNPPLAMNCNHSSIPEVRICRLCLQRCLDIQFTSPGSEPLSCPLCRARLSHDEIRQWADPQTFQAYDNMKTREALEEDGEFITCIRPDCGNGQLHVGGRENPIVMCRSCGTRTCFVHRGASWHQGFSCEEYDRLFVYTGERRGLGADTSQNGCSWLRRIGGWRACRADARQHRTASDLSLFGPINWTTEDLRSQRTIWQIAKPCPRCNAITEREGGCKYMRCMCEIRLLGSIR